MNGDQFLGLLSVAKELSAIRFCQDWLYIECDNQTALCGMNIQGNKCRLSLTGYRIVKEGGVLVLNECAFQRTEYKTYGEESAYIMAE